MDFRSPISDVIPSAHGAVLAVLARAGRPLTGRAIAALTSGRVGTTRTHQVLSDLSQAGIVTKDEHPVGHLYELNRDHVAAPAIIALAGLRDELISRMSADVAAWTLQPDAVWLFGSAVRGEATSSSDIDVLVVRPERVVVDSEDWIRQVARLTSHARVWSGNDVQVVELSRTELNEWVDRDEPLVESLRREALPIAGAAPEALLRTGAHV